MNKNYVKQVLKERIIICVQTLLMYAFGLLVGRSLGNTPPANMYTWRFYAAKGTVETILPLLILIKAKELITLLLDYFCMATAKILRRTAQPNARLKSGNKRRITVKCWYALSLFYGQHSLDFQF